MNQTLEMVTFRSNPGVTEAQMMAVVEVTNDWLQSQPGFAYRTVSHDGDGNWTDQVWWDTLQNAETAAKAFPGAPEGQKMVALIDMSTAKMQHLTTLANVSPKGEKAA